MVTLWGNYEGISQGKAAIVVPEGVLFQTNSAFKQVKQELLENFNLHTILSRPAGVFPLDRVEDRGRGGDRQYHHRERRVLRPSPCPGTRRRSR